MMRWYFEVAAVSWLIACLVTAGGCDAPQREEATLTLATTTSTRDSGLLDELLPRFEDRTGIRVRVVAVGTGQALELGRRGDADVLLTHARDAELRFVAAGYGVRRIPVMANDFVLVGPPAWVAEFRGTSRIDAAFRRIAEQQLPFVSRGDQSGTHIKEMKIWEQAGVIPGGDWYLQAGTGMAQTLRIAQEKKAVTLTDRATFLAQREQLDLDILLEGDPLLLNPYAVIVVNPSRHPHVHSRAAQTLADFLVSPDVQQVIGQFGRQRFGEPLFFPTLERSANDGQQP